MSVHLGRQQGHLKSIELNRVTYHKALPHLDKFISNQHEHQHTLRKIHIEHSSLNDDDHFALKHIFNCCLEICIIELISNHFNLAQANSVLRDLSANHLRSLRFTDNWIGEKVPESFFECIRAQFEINNLDFSENWLRDRGVSQLVQFINPSLKKLHLSCNDFSLEGMKAICKFILDSHQLVELDVSYNHIDSKAASHISRMIHDSNSLNSLKINSNHLGDHGAFAIADALHQKPSTFNLDVSDNQISIEGAKYLINAFCSQATKKHINLKHNSFCNADLAVVINKGLQNNPFLEVDY